MDGRGVSWLGVIWLAVLSVAQAAEHEFRLTKPEALSVSLMGEFNSWKGQAMAKGSDGVWVAKVSLGAGTYAYKFLVNGSEWIFDPENAKTKLIDGVPNSAVEISEDSAAVATPSPRLTSSPSSASSAPGQDLEITPGEISIREVPLSEKRRAQAAAEKDPKLMNARIGVAVPSGFDSQKSWPILAVCNTEAYSNIDSARQFKDAANAEGWVVLGADGVEMEKNKEGGPRAACFGAAFDYLLSVWPGEKDWPVASAGMSGGGKNGAFLAAMLAREHHRVIGMLMMGCNQDMATVAYRREAPPVTFLRASVFLSSGKSDTIATPAQHEYVKGSLRGSGFFQVRLESFDGAHDIYQPHIGEALRWFVAEAEKNAPASAPSKSSFDQFFKKKP